MRLRTYPVGASTVEFLIRPEGKREEAQGVITRSGWSDAVNIYLLPDGRIEAVRDGTFAKMIEAAQGSDIDTVSGATITTTGVKQAVDDALNQAADMPADQAKSGN